MLVAFHALRGSSEARTDIPATLYALVAAENIEQGEVVVSGWETLRDAAVDGVDDN